MIDAKTIAFNKVIQKVDSYNLNDPNKGISEVGDKVAKEWIYSVRMSMMLEALYPNTSNLVKLAARGQHIGRWEIKREDFPKGKIGYLKWRETLKKRHAALVGRFMEEENFSDAEIELVKKILLKHGLKKVEEVQQIEDVACLVFVKYYLQDFMIKHDETKVKDILIKTYKKMSVEAQHFLPAVLPTTEIEQLINNILNPK